MSKGVGFILTIAFWWLTEEVTPDLIPHSEVKLFRGNDTHYVGKVARRQNRVVNIVLNQTFQYKNKDKSTCLTAGVFICLILALSRIN